MSQASSLSGQQRLWGLLSQGQPSRKPGVATALGVLTKHITVGLVMPRDPANDSARCCCPSPTGTESVILFCSKPPWCLPEPFHVGVAGNVSWRCIMKGSLFCLSLVLQKPGITYSTYQLWLRVDSFPGCCIFKTDFVPTLRLVKRPDLVHQSQGYTGGGNSSWIKKYQPTAGAGQGRRGWGSLFCDGCPLCSGDQGPDVTKAIWFLLTLA